VVQGGLRAQLGEVMRVRELGHVVLYVTSVEKLSRFYRETLGFRQVASAPGMAVFSSGRTHHELLLIEVGGQPQKIHAKLGLYHIGLKIGDSEQELRAAAEELRAAGVPVTGATDHGVTKSLYLQDPDGNEVELYVDVSDSWKQHPEAILARPRALRL